MSATVFMLVLGWVAVAFLGGVLIGTAVRIADEHEQPMPVEDYAPTEVWL